MGKRWHASFGTVHGGGDGLRWSSHWTRRGALKAADFLAAFVEMRLAVEHDDGVCFVAVHRGTVRWYYREVRRG